MRYLILAAAFVVFFPLFSVGQTKTHSGGASAFHRGGTSVLMGKVTDGKDAIPFATITLLHKDSTVAEQTISKSDGSFTLSDLSDAPCILTVSAVGYATSVRHIPAGHHPASDPFNTGAIRLKSVTTQLAVATVVRARPVFRTEVDKKVFNVDQSLASKGGTAQDALRQVPTLQVDASGNVSLRNGSPTILLDGKQTSLTLDQIPADQIESIEVMPNPSAKYDAQGNHGIVNIVLKKNRKPGLNGSVTGVWNSLHENYGFFNMNAYKHRWNFTLNLMVHTHRSVSNTTSTLEDLATNSSVLQRGHAVTTGPFRMARAGVDFYMDDHNSFSLSGNVGFGSHPSSGTQTTSYLDSQASVDSSSARTSYQGDNFVFTHSRFNYTHTFNRPDEKWSTDAALETYNGHSNGNYDMQYLAKDGSALGSAYLQQYTDYGHAHTLTLQSDFSDPFPDGKTKLETGIKTIQNGNHSFMNFQDNYGQGYFVDTNASYNYSYTNATYAAYASFTQHVSERFNYMAGLRYEAYDYAGHILQGTGGAFGYHTNGLYPSVFLTEKLGSEDVSELHLNYSRRINRPRWWQISPQINYGNPQNPQAGNPHIRPENTNLVELGYNTQFGNISFSSTLYLKNTLDPMTAYNIPISKDTLLSTFENARYTNTYGAEIIVRTPITKWWDATTNLNLFQTDINASNLAQGLSNSGLSGFVKLNSNMKLFSTYTFQLTGNYNAQNYVAQGKILPSGGIDIAIRRDFLKNNSGTVVLSLADVFNTERSRTDTYTPGVFYEDAISKPETRVFKINFTYSFGRELNGERHKADIDNKG
ncbi:MAG TPA: TonB-dependent receptor [Puia sp.]|nr:TonB-dependent receptor [Puia sp.]